MASLVFEFKGDVIATSSIVIIEDDLQYFAPWLVEALQSYDLKSTPSVVSDAKRFLVALDLPDFVNANVTDMTASLRAYERLYEHRGVKPNGMSRYYPSASVTTSDLWMRNLNSTSRIILLTLLDYLGNDTLLQITLRSYTELLEGLSLEELRRVTGNERSDYPTFLQLQQLREIYLL